MIKLPWTYTWKSKCFENSFHNINILHNNLFSFFSENITDFRFYKRWIDANKFHEDTEKVGILIFICDLKSKEIDSF